MKRLRELMAWVWLLLFGAYQLAGAHESAQGARGELTAAIGDIFWMVNWRMFTGFSRSHTAILFYGFDGQTWRELPMEQWYPARWESGYRWERPWVYGSGELIRAFLGAACARSGDQATRMVKKTWHKTLGQAEQPDDDAKLTVLGTLPCTGERELPRGRVY
jgi:hypothetical protein